jgi:hypothetical protein
MHLELTDEQTEALIRELSQIIDGDRYPLSPRWPAGSGRRRPCCVQTLERLASPSSGGRLTPVPS